MGNRRVSNSFYYIAFFITIFLNFIGHTMFSEKYPILLNIRKEAFVLAILLLGIKIITDRIYIPHIYVYSVLVILFCIMYFNIDNSFSSLNLILIFLFIIGMYGINIRNILKLWIFLIVILMIIVSFGINMDIIDNVVTIRRGAEKVQLGYIHAPLSANYFFQFTLIYVLYRENRIKNIELMILLLVNYYLYIKTDTQSAFYYSLLIIILRILVNYIVIPRVVIEKVNKYILVVGAIIPIFLSYFFDSNKEYYSELNRLLTGRLYLGKTALEDYGLSILGQKVNWVLFDDVTQDNNFLYVDSSFLNIAINYGVILLLLLIIGFYIIGRDTKIKNNVYFMICFSVLVLHAMFDPQFLELVYNPMLLFLGLIFNNILDERENKDDINSSSYI